MTSLTTFDIPFMESLPHSIFIDDYNNASVWTVIQNDPTSTRIRIHQSKLEFILRLSNDFVTNAHRPIPINTPSFGWKYSVQANVSAIPHTNQFNNFSNIALNDTGFVAGQRTFGPIIQDVTDTEVQFGWLSYFNAGGNAYNLMDYRVELNTDLLYVLEHPTAITIKQSLFDSSGNLLITETNQLGTTNPRFRVFNNFNYGASAPSPTTFSATSEYMRLEN